MTKPTTSRGPQGQKFIIGFAARECLKKLEKSDLISKKQLADFYNECIDYVKTTIFKLFARSPLGSVVVRNADSVSPRVVAKTEIGSLVSKMARRNGVFNH